ncbi:MAG: rhomboid family intramembrane serine protease [Methanomethylovorans sp.]|nr:rhomboid family intramembrane serine protease [Methanomethylovorans sp.]
MANTEDESCWICGKKEFFLFTCRYCGKNFCAAHRLPEQHACEGLEFNQRYPGYYGRKNNKNTDYNSHVFKGILLTTLKQALKGTIKNTWRIIMNSMKTSPSMTIIYICLISFFIGNILIGPSFFNFFKLTPAYMTTMPWTIITHMFLHVDFGHLFFNMLVLFFFGRELEYRVGNRTFLLVYFISGIVAALGYVLTVSNPFSAVVGASGAILGVFATLTVLAPDLKVYVYFIPMQIKYALLLFALLDFALIGSNDMVAHTAHLSGILIGLFLGLRIKNTKKYNMIYDDYY